VRDRQDGERGPHHLLETTGGSVLMCSYTTTVGYATLLLSANGGIRAFGLAALLGEISCIAIALLVAPALFALLRRRDQRAQGQPPEGVRSSTEAAGDRGSAGAAPAADRARA
jgi:predicted RND superfamily exporter protein